MRKLTDMDKTRLLKVIEIFVDVGIEAADFLFDSVCYGTVVLDDWDEFAAQIIAAHERIGAEMED